MSRLKRSHVVTVLAAALLAVVPRAALAHCDTLDGPVVADARTSLQRGEVTPVLRWVQPADEPEIRAAFTQTIAVRALSDQARELADRAFFETLVRVHRAGEGAPYTGLKPAGGEVDPGIRVADEAVESGSNEHLVAAMSAYLHEGLEQRFQRVVATRAHADDSVAAGRAFVAAYVEYIHYVEALHAAVVGGGHAHGEEAAVHGHE